MKDQKAPVCEVCIRDAGNTEASSCVEEEATQIETVEDQNLLAAETEVTQERGMEQET